MSIEKESQRWELIKFIVFAITFISPTIIMFFSTGRLVLPFLFLFPAGLLYLLFPYFLFPNLLLGWIIYIALMIVGIKSKKPRMFLVTYFVFVILMLINLKGCSLMMEDSSNSSW